MRSKILCITGANGQTGVSLANHYIANQNDMLLLYHKRHDRIDKLKTTENVLKSSVDLLDKRAIAASLEQSRFQFGQVPNILIHCASVRSTDSKSFNKIDDLAWWKVFDTNVQMFFNILKLLLPSMQESKFGRIIVFGSKVTQTGLPFGSAYSASKAAIANVIKSVSGESDCDDFKAYTVSPGPIDTILEDDYSGSYLEFRKKYFEDYLQASGNNKLLDLSELVILCDALINDTNEYSNGQEIYL